MEPLSWVAPRGRSRGDPLGLQRIPFGLVFLASGVLKYGSLTAFREALTRFDLLPLELIAPASLVIPGVEVVLGGMIVLRRATGLALHACNGLLAVFTGVLIAKITEGAQMSCACFGSMSAGPIDWWTVAGNGGLILVGPILCASYESKSESRNQPVNLESCVPLHCRLQNRLGATTMLLTREKVREVRAGVLSAADSIDTDSRLTGLDPSGRIIRGERPSKQQ